MAIELITGRAGTTHVGSEDVRAYQAYTAGSGRYVLHGGGAVVQSANSIHVNPAELLLDGAHVRITGTGEDVTIENGASSYKRADIIALHYLKTGDENAAVETVELAVVKGTPADADPQDPDMPADNNLLDNPTETYIPYVRVLIDGLTPQTPIILIDDYENPAEAANGDGDSNLVWPIKNGGTGATSGTAALNALGIRAWLLANVFKVGYVWISYTSTSPASILGGTWTPITGRFPYFDAGTGTGGSNTHTLSTGEMPSHGHLLKGHTWNWAAQSGSGTHLGVTDVGDVYIGDPYTSNSLATIQDVFNQSNASGGGASHNNMPAYQTLYAWRRTA